MTEEPAQRKSAHRPGIWLVVIGGLIALGMTIYILLVAPDRSSAPLWIVAGWGALVFLFGLYRVIRGPSSLDDPRGGTDANGR